MSKNNLYKSLLMKAFTRFGFQIVFVLMAANIGMVVIIRLFILAQLPCFTIEQLQSDSRCLYILNDKVYEKGTRDAPHYYHPCGSDVTAAIAAVPFHLADAPIYLDSNLRGQICAVNPLPTPDPIPDPTLSSNPTPNPSASPILYPTLTDQSQYVPPVSSPEVIPSPDPGIGGPVYPTSSPNSTPKTNTRPNPTPIPQKLFLTQIPKASTVPNNFLNPRTPALPVQNTASISPSPTPVDLTNDAIFWTQLGVNISFGLLAFTFTIMIGRHIQLKRKERTP